MLKDFSKSSYSRLFLIMSVEPQQDLRHIILVHIKNLESVSDICSLLGWLISNWVNSNILLKELITFRDKDVSLLGLGRDV